MAWRLTNDVAVYAERTWDLLARSPAEHTMTLTMIESVRGGHRPSDESMLFGWYADRGQVRGAVWLTPPFELLLAVVPHEAVEDLVAALRAEDVSVPGAYGDDATVERFAAAWIAGTSLRTRTSMRQRLYALATLTPAKPLAAGRARPAGEDDLELAVLWLGEFQAEVEVPHTDPEHLARKQIDDRRLWLWEDQEGSSVSLAGRTAPAAGVARIAPVYTPPERRRHGYATAVTAACTADALHRGADHVVLFTDLDDPTSNAVYQRIGYRPMSDRRIVRFAS